MKNPTIALAGATCLAALLAIGEYPTSASLNLCYAGKLAGNMNSQVQSTQHMQYFPDF